MWRSTDANCCPQVKPENLERVPAPRPPPVRQAKPAAQAARSSDEWWAGKTQAEAYSWFVDAYMLRVEQEYAHGGNFYGAYADATGCGLQSRWASCAERDFTRFLASAHSRLPLPPWWSDDACWEAAAPMIGFAIEASDIKEKHGPLAPLMLCALAARITGGAVGGDAGMGTGREEDEKWYEDEEEWEEEDEFDEGGALEEEDDYGYEYSDDDDDDGDDDDDDDDALTLEEKLCAMDLKPTAKQQRRTDKAWLAAQAAAAAATPPRCVLLGSELFDTGNDFYVERFQEECAKRGMTCQPFDLPSRRDGKDGMPRLTAALRAALPGAACLVVLRAERVAPKVLSPMRDALRDWVRAGGLFAVNGERDGVKLLAALFSDATPGWGMADYRRTDADLSATCAAVPRALHMRVEQRLPPCINAKACMLSGVQPEQRLYSPPAGAVAHSLVPGFGGAIEPGLCSMAAAMFGAGRVLFFGDVNAEWETVSAVLQLAAPGTIRRDEYAELVKRGLA